ncbi:MAG: hypothetical protein V1775_13585 [Bacteroidota bacterium]
MKKLYLIGILVLTGFLYVSSQDIELEKTYDLSKDAKKGFLGDVRYNDQNESYLLSYCTKSKKTFAKFENYTFDKDFNFVNMTQEELEFDKVKSKYAWWRYKGEDFSTESIYADDNASGTLILRKVRRDYNWSWLWGMYNKVVLHKLEKVKLRSEDGDKYYYYSSHADDETNELYVLCGKKDKTDRDTYKKEFHILKINFQLDVVKDYQVSFTKPVDFKFFGSITDEGHIKQLFIVFNSGSEYTYVRVDSKLEQKDKIDFTANPGWKIDDFIPPSAEEDNIYIYGPSADKYYTLVKVDNGKLGYVSDVNLDEFKQKLKCPPSQRRTPEYRGKKFVLDASLLTKDDELVITGQNWSTKYNVVEDKLRDVYTDVLTFYFDANGKLKAQYGVDPKKNNEEVKLFGNDQDIIEGENNLYWILYESPKFRSDYPSIMKINKKTFEINDPVDFGKETYFLEPSFPMLKVKDENKVVFFGANKKGNTIWFCKVRFD